MGTGKASKDGPIQHLEVGETSQPVRHAFPGDSARALLVHGRTQVVIVSTRDGFFANDALHVSTNGGHSWSKGWLPARPVKAACFTPKGELLLATTPGVWRGVPQSRGTAHRFNFAERFLYRSGD